MRLAMKLGTATFVIAAAFVAFFLAAPRTQAAVKVSGDWDSSRCNSCYEYDHDYDYDCDWDSDYRDHHYNGCDCDNDRDYDRCDYKCKNVCKPSYNIVKTAKTIYVPKYEVRKYYVPKTICVAKVQKNYCPTWNNCYSCR